MGNTLYLHIGLHKTGSSSIQRFLGLNREVLHNLGVIVPGDKVTENLHHDIALKASRKVDIDVARRRFRNTIETFCNEGDIIVLSSEVFIGYNLIHFEVLNELKNFFSNIRVIVYIRRGDYMLESAYNQIVKKTLEYRHFHMKEWYRLKYSHLLSPVVDIFGADNILIRPFEKEQFVGN